MSITDEMVASAARAVSETDCERGNRPDLCPEHCLCLRIASAALEAAEAVRKEAGFVIVPAEPTEEMLDAAFECKKRHNDEWPAGEYSGPALDPSGEEYWHVMLAARPK